MAEDGLRRSGPPSAFPFARLPLDLQQRVISNLIHFRPLAQADLIHLGIPTRLTASQRACVALRATSRAARDAVDGHRHIWWLCRVAVYRAAERGTEEDLLRLVRLMERLRGRNVVMIGALWGGGTRAHVVRILDEYAERHGLPEGDLTMSGATEVFHMAALHGACQVVRAALRAGVNPSSEHNLAVQQAATWGHAEVVRLLLADPRVDPRASDCYALRSAARCGREDVVRLLLEDGRVSNDAVRMASREAEEAGHVTLVRLLGPRARPEYSV